MAIIYHHLAILWTMIQASWTNHPSSKHQPPPLHHPSIPCRTMARHHAFCMEVLHTWCRSCEHLAQQWKAEARRAAWWSSMVTNLVESRWTNNGGAVATGFLVMDGGTPYEINHYKTIRNPVASWPLECEQGIVFGHWDDEISRLDECVAMG